jgi:hypothetical protein
MTISVEEWYGMTALVGNHTSVSEIRSEVVDHAQNV